MIGFGRKYPDRYFNFGIAERNMIGAAAGLATTGHIAVISNYSFFLALMGVENIRNDICYPGLNVRMIGTHSGLAMGFYGTSHHCNEDIGALRAIAGLTLMAPCDGNAIRAAFTPHHRRTTARSTSAPAAAARSRSTTAPPAWRIGGSQHAARGPARHRAGDRQPRLRQPRGGRAAARPKASSSAWSTCTRSRRSTATPSAAPPAQGVVITAEEHNVSAGFGSAVAEVMAEEGLGASLVRIGMPDEYSLLGPPTHLYRHYGLDAEGVAAAVRKALA